MINWEAIGAVAELAGAAAVVLTLFYLASQLRQNNRLLDDSAHATYYKMAAQDMNSIANSDPKKFEVMERGMADPESLDRGDLHLFNSTLHAMFITFQYCYRMRQRDALDESITGPNLENMLMLLSQPGGKSWWERYPVLMEDDFTQFVNERTGLTRRISTDFQHPR